MRIKEKKGNKERTKKTHYLNSYNLQGLKLPPNVKTQLFYPKEIKAQKFNFSFYYSQETNKNTTFINPKYPEAKTHTNHQNNQELETKHKKIILHTIH